MSRNGLFNYEPVISPVDKAVMVVFVGQPRLLCVRRRGKTASAGNGRDGPDGPDGQDGPDGRDGQDGRDGPVCRGRRFWTHIRSGFLGEGIFANPLVYLL
ncbi:MAG: hypothetical protein WCX86_13015 [Candidatus Hydrogenedentales bacterium]